MAFRLHVSNTVTVPVSGKLPGPDGKLAPFSFELQARRLQQSELREFVEQNTSTVPEVLAEVVTGWSKVLDDDGNEAPFTQAAFAQLMDIVGMSGLIFAAYLEACGAKGVQKN